MAKAPKKAAAKKAPAKSTKVKTEKPETNDTVEETNTETEVENEVQAEVEDEVETEVVQTVYRFQFYSVEEHSSGIPKYGIDSIVIGWNYFNLPENDIETTADSVKADLESLGFSLVALVDKKEETITNKEDQ